MRAGRGFPSRMTDVSWPEMKDYGIKPDRKPHMTAETEKRANEKRQATRARRGIIGKRRRARMKRQG